MGGRNGGRRKGIPNKATQEVRELAQRMVNDPAYMKALKVRMVEGKAGMLESTLWHYAYGKPREAPENLRQEIRVFFGGRFKQDE